jgi:methyltransferase (TIGR00027 family)
MAEIKESRTALGVAWMRALHQVLDSKPLILEDEPIVELLGRYYVERASKQTERFQSPGSRLLRSHVVLRSRFTEDRLEQSVNRGVEQFVILGAGYDTFFARQPAWARSLTIFEIDQPATQEDKLARISAARISVPSNVVFGSVNFEVESVAAGLRRHGVRFDVPTVFSWLGVTMYLTEAAIDATLNTVLEFPRGSEIVLTFATPERRDEPAIMGFPSRAPAADAGTPSGATDSSAPSATPGVTSTTPVPPGATLAAMAAAVGEPWLTFYEPDEIERKLRHAGFSAVDLVTPEIANDRYFAGRPDGLPSPQRTHLLSATV